MNRRRTDAIAAALEAAAPDLMRYLLRRTSSREEAADLFGEVSLIAWRRRADAPGDGEDIRPWLFVTARHVAANAWRASRRTRDLTEALRREPAPPAPDPAERSAEVDLVRRLLASLPSDDAELLRLVHWDGLAVADAAGVLGIPPSTARSRYARAKRRVREILDRGRSET